MSTRNVIVMYTLVFSVSMEAQPDVAGDQKPSACDSLAIYANRRARPLLPESILKYYDQDSVFGQMFVLTVYQA